MDRCLYVKKALFVALLFCCSPLFAEQQGELGYGTVDSIYHEKSAFVVGDLYKGFDLDLQVFAVDGRMVDRYALVVGQKVVYQMNENNRHSVSMIWIKPNSFDGLPDEDE
jgi:hypothetical protein